MLSIDDSRLVVAGGSREEPSLAVGSNMASGSQGATRLAGSAAGSPTIQSDDG